jgi:hypothetical protein
VGDLVVRLDHPRSLAGATVGYVNGSTPPTP